ncbi:MAG: cytidine deaminase [Bacteroidetes bacterium HGW-Bacteroidetes-4]|nr:MAG: cytidine deaminase [Bacteroidetes bacterium HGW-Bacteroidetes-4]
MKKEYITTVFEYESEKELSTEYQQLISLAREATLKAYAPYSNFSVGASVLLANGEVFSANNQENAAYPSGLCAERVAIFYANSNYPDVPVKAIAVCASNSNGILNTPVPPCGACRQVLLETEMRFESPIEVILVGKQRLHAIKNIAQLLPLNFLKSNLSE